MTDCLMDEAPDVWESAQFPVMEGDLAVGELNDRLTMGSCQVWSSVRRQVCRPKRPTRPPCRVHRDRPLSWLPTSSSPRPEMLCTLDVRCWCARHQATCPAACQSWA